MVMELFTEHDRRQIARASERLDLFIEEKISLRVLIADLEFLLSALENVSDAVHSELHERWAVLEEVHSVAVALHDGKVSVSGKSAVEDAVRVLRDRVAELLSSASRDVRS
jgi:hypothetical protein